MPNDGGLRHACGKPSLRYLLADVPSRYCTALFNETFLHDLDAVERHRRAGRDHTGRRIPVAKPSAMRAQSTAADPISQSKLSQSRFRPLKPWDIKPIKHKTTGRPGRWSENGGCQKIDSFNYLSENRQLLLKLGNNLPGFAVPCVKPKRRVRSKTTARPAADELETTGTVSVRALRGGNVGGGKCIFS